jgi:hypothetical protein
MGRLVVVSLGWWWVLMGRDEQWAGFELQARGGLTSFWLGWAEPQMGWGMC